jgi:hypothetical protein
MNLYSHDDVTLMKGKETMQLNTDNNMQLQNKVKQKVFKVFYALVR